MTATEEHYRELLIAGGPEVVRFALTEAGTQAAKQVNAHFREISSYLDERQGLLEELAGWEGKLAVAEERLRKFEKTKPDPWSHELGERKGALGKAQDRVRQIRARIQAVDETLERRQSEAG